MTDQREALREIARVAKEGHRDHSYQRPAGEFFRTISDLAEVALAALPSTPQPEGLDEAWAEAEAAAQALGPDWHVAVVNRDVRGDEYHGWRASANDGKYLEQSRHADTPAAALRALAARLAPPPPEPTADTEDDPEPEVHGEASMLRREYWKRRRSDD